MPSCSSSVDPPPLEVLPWLKGLPVAPEYHPTPAEFRDPIAYIHKIEREASQYGICKIVPPFPAAPKKTAVANLNRSFAALQHNLSGRSSRGGGSGSVSSLSKKAAPTFTTRQQQIGLCPRRPWPVQKPVWQSGEQYTLQKFESKAKQFEKACLRRTLGGAGGSARKGGLSPLEVETLFWKACADKPFSVEYANDMPCSGFGPVLAGRRWKEGDAATVGETAWNMRGVSRAKGSLLGFMKEEIPGVTSPMVHVAMLFCWFAWHVEVHELHSLNYLHMGAGKAWYSVPRDAGLAFEEVVRVHGYGGEVNPLVTFAILGEKTTVLSPEVLMAAGIPCCRLVQNAGEFVITFPGSYHSGFSLGFNCGEAANIATPDWLRVAKEAAIRRASINYPPMVSHFQLLYELALSLCDRVPTNNSSEPRSSRLKDKLKGEGELMIKELFVESVMQNNEMLHFLLGKHLSCIVLPQNTFDIALASNSQVRSQNKVKLRLSHGLCTQEEALEASKSFLPDDIPYRNVGLKLLHGLYSGKQNSSSAFDGKRLPFVKCSKTTNVDSCASVTDSQCMDIEKGNTLTNDGLLDQGLLSCVTCGILSFACVAVVQPTDKAARYLMNADCGPFNDLYVGYGVTGGGNSANKRSRNCDPLANAGQEHGQGGSSDVVQNTILQSPVSGCMADLVPDVEAEKSHVSALDLLASAYGGLSDSEEEALQSQLPVCTDENDIKIFSASTLDQQSRHLDASVSSPKTDITEALCGKLHYCRADVEGAENWSHPSSCVGSGNGRQENIVGSPYVCASSCVNAADRCQQKCDASLKELNEDTERNKQNNFVSSSPNSSSSNPVENTCGYSDSVCISTDMAKIHPNKGELRKPGSDSSYYSVDLRSTATGNVNQNIQLSNSNAYVPLMQKSDRDSSRMHVFCLEHAFKVEKQLHQIGGAQLMLICHPDYPKIEMEAKALTEKLGINYTWRDVSFRKANKVDQQRIQSALEDEEAIPTNSDWTAKLGINLYYSANLSKSLLYSKQLPYNAVIYKAFGCDSSGVSPGKFEVYKKPSGRQKKFVVAGKWCGKVWMSNQVHPYLVQRNDTEEQDVERSDPEAIDKKCGTETGLDNCKQVILYNRRSSGARRMSDKKRKKSSGKLSSKKSRCTTVEDTHTTVEDLTENPVQCGRILRSSMPKPIQTHLQNYKEKKTDGRSKQNLKHDTTNPSTRLRKRPSMSEGIRVKPEVEKQVKRKKSENPPGYNFGWNEEDGEYPCNIVGCSMSFNSKHDLVLHKRNVCPVKGCGKKLFSHKYLVQHRRVHMEDRPLKCPWKGCKMTFKWAWARTEHIRVHTGARPYVCKEAGCGQTFRFVSDFSRHKRKTGHVSRKGRG